MFYNFSKEAHSAVEYATNLASRSGGLIGTEHLLVGVLTVDKPLRIMFESMGVSPKSVLKQICMKNTVESTVQVSDNSAIVIKKSQMLAEKLFSAEVEPVHILIAILDTPSISTSILMANNIDPKALSMQLINEEKKRGVDAQHTSPEDELFTDLEEMYKRIRNIGSKGMPFQEERIDQKSIKEGWNEVALSGIVEDLTEKAGQDKIDPVIGRKNEIERIIQILSRRTKNNPVLIGEPGVGKTAIVEGLARAIVEGNVPETLKDKRIFALDISSVVAGTKYRGEFEEKLKNAIEAIKNAKDIIVFIDEIHMIVGAGAGNDGTIDAANILKPILARGELQVVGATTVEEYGKIIEKDAALERRFQPIMVEPPSVKDTITILEGLRDKYEEHHKVRITDEALKAAAELSDRYINDRYLPDKAIDLIDEAASRKRMMNYKVPDAIIQLENRIRELEKEIKERVNGEDYVKASALKQEKEETIKKLSKSKLNRATEENSAMFEIGEEDIAEIVSNRTGIPVVKLTEAESARLMNLEMELQKRVIGQREAISALCRAIRRARAGLGDPNRPIGSFIFLGPTGVGKTELCKALAETLFGDENNMVRIDMSEYMDKLSISKLTGSAPGYVGYEEGGQLTEKIRRKPYSVVLFDEIEKAHPDIFNILLQILDDGRLTDSHGRTVNFKNTIIIMTSNIGSDIGKTTKRLGFGLADDWEDMREKQIEALKKVMRPEFLNRPNDIILFHSLTKENLSEIAEIMLGSFYKKIESKNINMVLTDEAKKFIINTGTNIEYGARPLRRTMERLLEDPLSEMLLSGELKIGDKVIVDYLGGEALTFTKGK